MDATSATWGRALAWGAVVTVAAWGAGTAVWLARGGSRYAVWGPGGPDRPSLMLLALSVLALAVLAHARGTSASRPELALLGTAVFVAVVAVVQTGRAWEAGAPTALSIGLDGFVWAFVNGGALVAFVVGLVAAPWVRRPPLPTAAGSDDVAGRSTS